jgi:phage terminase large subunit-like protein
VLIGKIDRVWHVRPWFWLPSETVYEHAKSDRVPYDKWLEQGYLETVPGHAITYDVAARRVCEILAMHPGLRKIGFDRWNFAQFKPWLTHHQWNDHSITEKWVEFGQGLQSMSPALRELESRILRKEIAHGGNPIMNMCAANAVIEGGKDGATKHGFKKDSAARKLSKKRSTGRIDGLVALAMAVGIAPMGAPVDIASLIA